MTPNPTAPARGRSYLVAALMGVAAILAACDTVAVVGPRPAPRVILNVPDGCVLVSDPALRARVITRLEPGFRGPRHGRHRITLEEHLRTHRYRVFDCGDTWRIVFIASGMSPESSYVLLRKDGVVLYQPY